MRSHYRPRRAPASLAGRRAASAAAVLALALLAGTAAAETPIMTETQRLEWPFSPSPQLPAASHLGALAGMSRGSAAFVLGAPNGGAVVGITATGSGTGRTFDDLQPTAVAIARDGSETIVALLAADGTSSIERVFSNAVLVSGISGRVISLAIEGDFLAFGHLAGPGFPPSTGNMVKIYERDAGGSWVFAKSFNGTATNGLGSSLALHWPLLVAGAPGEGASGAVFTYLRASSWIPWQTITAPASAGDGAGFGRAVDLDLPWLAVGAPLRDKSGGLDAGGVYLYEEAGFGVFELRTLKGAVGLDEYDYFGSSVAVDGIALAVGAPGDDDDGFGAGAAYVFLRPGTSWNEWRRLTDSSAENYGAFGTAIAAGPHGVLVGAPNADANGVFDQGAALFFAGATPFFYDGFESGNVSVWSAAVP